MKRYNASFGCPSPAASNPDPASPSPGRVLVFAAPAHSSAFFEDVNRELRSISDDLSKVPAIGQRHGIEFMPPDRLTVYAEPGAVLQLRIARQMKGWRPLIEHASQRVSSDMYPRCS
jgi:hypothetical protein